MDIDAYRTRYHEAVQAACDQPVEAIAVLTRPGAIGNVLTSQFSGLLYLLKERSAKKKGGGLPRNVIAALTPTSVELFDYRPRGTGIKLRAKVATWARAGLRIEADTPGPMSQRLHVTLPDGTTLDVDSARGMGSSEMNGPFLRALGVALV